MSVKIGFRINIECLTKDLNEFTPEDVRFAVADALEGLTRPRLTRPQLQEGVDFSLEVSRTYE